LTAWMQVKTKSVFSMTCSAAMLLIFFGGGGSWHMAHDAVAAVFLEHSLQMRWPLVHWKMGPLRGTTWQMMHSSIASKSGMLLMVGRERDECSREFMMILRNRYSRSSLRLFTVRRVFNDLIDHFEKSDF
jgi:hypothetical protein